MYQTKLIYLVVQLPVHRYKQILRLHRLKYPRALYQSYMPIHLCTDICIPIALHNITPNFKLVRLFCHNDSKIVNDFSTEQDDTIHRSEINVPTLSVRYLNVWNSLSDLRENGFTFSEKCVG